MKATIAAKPSYRLATEGDLPACLDILMDSILGEEYFTRELAEAILGEALAKRELRVARLRGEVVGFFRLALDGVFLVFAYVHLFAVKTGHRGQGLGTAMLNEAERLIRAERGYPDVKKSFLLVGKINRRAKRFYESQGYRRIATLDDLFARGDTEYLMMKELA